MHRQNADPGYEPSKLPGQSLVNPFARCERAAVSPGRLVIAQLPDGNHQKIGRQPKRVDDTRPRAP